MITKAKGLGARVFISHSSANLKAAQEVCAALRETGADPWLDLADIRVGGLLRRQLQEAITASDVVVLLWSKPAAASRWVAAEILTAYHLDRFVVPCVLSGAALPPFMSGDVHVDLRRRRADALRRLGEQVQRAPRRRNECSGAKAFQDAELRRRDSRPQRDSQKRASSEPGPDVRRASRRPARPDQDRDTPAYVGRKAEVNHGARVCVRPHRPLGRASRGRGCRVRPPDRGARGCRAGRS